METLIIEGTPSLQGKTRISGYKNGTLPLIAASILTDKQVIIEDVPCLLDIEIMCEIGLALGMQGSLQKNTLLLNSSSINQFTAPSYLTNKLRASFLMLGPLLVRFGRARISLPGGCSIGSRPTDLHLKGLAAMGAEFEMESGFVNARADRLKGNTIFLDYPSVGATENILMAATLAEGETVIENAAREPEIAGLCHFLSSMGADISGIGTGSLKIRGVDSLQGSSYRVIPDRIEAGTFIIAAAITGGEVIVENVIPEHLVPLTSKLDEMGILVKKLNPGEVAVETPEIIRPVNVRTMPCPGFPSDLQPPLTSLMTQAHGLGIVRETVFENRFRHIESLTKMGADAFVDGNNISIRGKNNLVGTRIRPYDLRGAASLVLAALAAKGVTEIQDIYHLDRGYENLELKLKNLGCTIYREKSRTEKTCPDLLESTHPDLVARV